MSDIKKGPSKVSRREFLRNVAVAVPAGAVVLNSSAQAADLPQLAADDPTAKALGYVENAANVDPAKWPTFKAGSDCANCLQIQGNDGDAYRPCAIFPGKTVAAAGWCSVWVAKPQ